MGPINEVLSLSKLISKLIVIVPDSLLLVKVVPYLLKKVLATPTQVADIFDMKEVSILLSKWQQQTTIMSIKKWIKIKHKAPEYVCDF